MDAKTFPSATAMSADAVSSQPPQVILTPTGGPSVSSNSNLHMSAWPPSASLESLKNGHVRASASLPKSQVDIQPSAARGHKRSATGEIKSVRRENQNQTQSNGLPGHLRTTSLDSTTTKIAELSAQLRARLSYAAAKVERSWVLQQQGESGSPQTNVAGGQNTRQPVQELRQLGDSFLEDPIVPGPASSRSYLSRSTQNGSVNQACLAGPTPLSPLQTHRLAPPADIVTGDKTKVMRRRLNPNGMDGFMSHQSALEHRRHHSELDGKNALDIRSSKADIPNTSLFTPSRSKPNGRTLTPQVSINRSPAKRRTPSQNALMEKDAIETLLFMSSPDNSGYQSGSQARKSSMSISIEAQIADSTHTSSQESNISGTRQPEKYDFFDHNTVRTALPASIADSYSIGLEAQAGDEIDRLLDQMEVDRRGEAEMISYNFDFGVNGHSGSYELHDASK